MSPSIPGAGLRTRTRVAAWATAAAALLAAGHLTLQRPAQATVEAPSAPPAMPVSVAAAIERQVTQWDEFSGRLEAVGGVEVRSRVAGYVEAVHFAPGALVGKGQTLFTIDPKPYAAEAARAEAAVVAAQARLNLTASELARARQLLDERAIAQREFDERQNAQHEARAALQGAQAALDAARLNLGYTRITAPIGGRVGRAEVTAGNLIPAGAGGPMLTSIVSISPIYASFEADERTYLKLAGGPAFRPADAGAQRIPVHLGLAHEEGHPRRGVVESVDNRVDPKSGTIRVRALFENRDGRLTPGLFARLKLGGSADAKAVLVTDRAVGTDQHKKFVYVVEDGNKVAYREVRLGAAVDGLRIVEDGLAAGEMIVVNGLQRVRPGATVAPTSVAMDDKAGAPVAASPARGARS